MRYLIEGRRQKGMALNYVDFCNMVRALVLKERDDTKIALLAQVNPEDTFTMIKIAVNLGYRVTFKK